MVHSFAKSFQKSNANQGNNFVDNFLFRSQSLFRKDKVTSEEPFHLIVSDYHDAFHVAKENLLRHLVVILQNPKASVLKEISFVGM